MIQYFTKGAANLCGVVELINEDFADEALKKEVEDRLMPRTEELPLYTTHEFNDKVDGWGGGCRDVVSCWRAALFLSFPVYLSVFFLSFFCRFYLLLSISVSVSKYIYNIIYLRYLVVVFSMLFYFSGYF